MSYSVKKTSIYLTRGDTFRATIAITDEHGEPYFPVEGEAVRFAMKKDYSDAECLIEKSIPIDTMEFILNPEDTKELDFGSYVYDIQITRLNGDVDTFITKASLTLTEEVE